MFLGLDSFQTGIAGVCLLIVMVLLGVRVFIAAAIVGFLGLLELKGWRVAASIAGTIPHSKTVTYPLSVLPLFILIGFLAFYAGLTTRLFEAARRWMGWVPGGLAVATVLATAGFAAVSGASTATAAVFSRVAIPDMLKNGYDKRLTAGVVAAGGTLASLIPPSAILVIYAIIVEQSVGKLLLAGFLPGIYSAFIYLVLIIGMCMWNPSNWESQSPGSHGKSALKAYPAPSRSSSWSASSFRPCTQALPPRPRPERSARSWCSCTTAGAHSAKTNSTRCPAGSRKPLSRQPS
jgi:TRAP-type mannitol/chloroaromatic compound transport system permease large subunit